MGRGTLVIGLVRVQGPCTESVLSLETYQERGKLTVGDGEGLRLGGSVGLAVAGDDGGSLWAEGGDGSYDLSSDRGIVTQSARNLVEGVCGGDEAEDGEDLNRLHYDGR